MKDAPGNCKKLVCYAQPMNRQNSTSNIRKYHVIFPRYLSCIYQVLNASYFCLREM